MSSPRAGVYFSVILAMIFWGFTFVAFKFANESFRPITIVFFRLFVSIFFLFGFALLFRRLVRIRKQDQKWFWLMALFEPFFYFLGEAYGLTLVTATIGAVIISTIPLIVPFAAYYFFRERLTLMNRIGLVISFGGVLMVILTKSKGISVDPKGILLLFAAVVSAVGYTMIVKKLIDDYNPITVTTYQSFYGLLMFLPLFLIMELPVPELQHVPTSSLLAVVYLGVFPAALAYVTWAYALSRSPASIVASFLYLSPVLATLIAWVWLREVPAVLSLAGGGLSLCGVVLVNTRGR